MRPTTPRLKLLTLAAVPFALACGGCGVFEPDVLGPITLVGAPLYALCTALWVAGLVGMRHAVAEQPAPNDLLAMKPFVLLLGVHAAPAAWALWRFELLQQPQDAVALFILQTLPVHAAVGLLVRRFTSAGPAWCALWASALTLWAPLFMALEPVKGEVWRAWLLYVTFGGGYGAVPLALSLALLLEAKLRPNSVGGGGGPDRWETLADED